MDLKLLTLTTLNSELSTSRDVVIADNQAGLAGGGISASYYSRVVLAGGVLVRIHFYLTQYSY
jgi:hypothetical protein